MAHFKGGRGKKVGYETQMYRIPSPMRPIVEKAGLQFRLLWDGLTDPTGEKLISRIERAIADPEQLGENYNLNQISGNHLVSVPDIKLTGRSEELGQSNGHSQISSKASSTHLPDIEYQRLEEELVSALREVTSWKAAAATLKDENKQLRSQLQEAGALAVEPRAEIEQLKAPQQNVHTNGLMCTPPAEPSTLSPLDLEVIAASPDYPAEDEELFEEMKVLSDDEISLHEETEEVEEGPTGPLPSTMPKSTTTSTTEAIPIIVSQPDVPDTEQPQPKGDDGVQAPSLRDRIMEVLEKHQTEVGTDKIRELLALPSDRKSKQSVTDALGDMVDAALIFRRPDPARKNRTLYRVLSKAEKAVLVKKLPLLEQLS